MQFTLSDLGTVATVAQQIDANPISLAGRLTGLSGDEIKAGVPTWAWLTLGVAAGGVLMYFAKRRFS
jgi:hypothetical protein